MIAAHGLVVQFGGVKALDDVDFTIRERGATAIVGPNGAGKSTLLNALNGVGKPAAGSIEIDGRRTTGTAAHKVARLGVHRSFQHPHLLEKESVLTNVMAGGHADFGLSWQMQLLRPLRRRRVELDLERRCRALLEQAGLGSFANTPAGDLSYGNKKLVDIARAMVGEPKAVLLDEPSSGMGDEDRARLIDLLAAFRTRSDAALVFVEHHMDVVQAVADQVVALATGRVAFAGDVAEVDDLEGLGVATGEAAATASTEMERELATNGRGWGR